MGSSASANKAVHQNDDVLVGENERPKSSPSTPAVKRSDIPETRLRRRPNSSSSKVVPIDLSNLEAENTSLRQKLESQHNNVKMQCSDEVSSDGQCPVAIDDRQVLQLRKELSKAQNHIKKIKAQYRRRVREFNTKLAECKQESAMESFDHKNAIAKLSAENAVLSAKVGELQKARDDGGACGDSSGVPSQMPDSRTTLILDLSSKVTEQETEILQLREQLNKQNLSTDAAGTLTKASESSSKYSDTGWRQRLNSPLHQDSVGFYGSPEETSDSLRYDGQSTSSASKAAIGRKDIFRSRTSKVSVDSYFKFSPKQEKKATSYRAHWASSCFDVDDLAKDDDGED